MTIDISPLASMVRRMDTSATLKSFIVVAFLLALMWSLWNLPNNIEFYLKVIKTQQELEMMRVDILGDENSINRPNLQLYVEKMDLESEMMRDGIPVDETSMRQFIILLIQQHVTLPAVLFAFIFWDWMVRQPWRHFTAVVGALIGAVGYAAISIVGIGIVLTIGGDGALSLEENDLSNVSVKLIISSVIGLVLAALMGWLTTNSKRLRQRLSWALVLALTLFLLAFLNVVVFLDVIFFVYYALLFWLFVRIIRHHIVLSGDMPRELLLGAIHRKSFWTRLAFLAGLPSSLRYASAMKTPAFWAFLIARPLVGMGVLSLFSVNLAASLDAPDADYFYTLMTSLGVALIVAGHFLFYVGKRLAARYIWNPDNPHDNRNTVLFLRSFEDDQFQFKQRPWWNIVGRWFDFWSFRRNVDEAMVDEIAQYGPIVALGMPGEKKIPFGAMRHYSTHEDWQKIVTNTAQKAQAIVIAAGDTPGVLWEYKLLSRKKLLDRTLLLFSPAAGDRSANMAALIMFAKVTNINLGFDIPEDCHIVALLNTDAGPTLLTAHEPTAAAYVAAVRAHFQKCMASQLVDSLVL